MHRHDAVRRQIEIQRGEHRLLHFAGIGRVADQDDLPGEVDGDDGVGAHAVARRIGLERRQIDDGQFRDEVGEFENVGADQQLTNEERVPGEFGIDARFYPVFRIGAAIEVLREQCLAARMRDHIVVEQFEIGLAELAVAVPPDGVFGQRIDDGVLVLGASPSMHAGFGAKRAALDQRAFAVPDRMLDQDRIGQIPVHAGEVFKAEFVGAVRAVPHTRFLHAKPPLVARLDGARDPPQMSAVTRSQEARDPIAEHPSICQDRNVLKPNRKISRSFRRCSAAKNIALGALAAPRLNCQIHHDLSQLLRRW